VSLHPAQIIPHDRRPTGISTERRTHIMKLVLRYGRYLVSTLATVAFGIHAN
jgi:hypothetical protein